MAYSARRTAVRITATDPGRDIDKVEHSTASNTLSISEAKTDEDTDERLISVVSHKLATPDWKTGKCFSYHTFNKKPEAILD